MTLWLVRAGRHGEREVFNLQNKLVSIGWEDVGDLSNIHNKETIKTLLEETYPTRSKNSIQVWVRQLWNFATDIQIGDLVAMPSKQQAVIYIAEVIGPYRFEPTNPIDNRHVRKVNWLGEIPRNKISNDLLYSLSAPPTINPVRVTDAEERVRRMLEGKEDGLSILTDVINENGGETEFDIEEFTRDQIRKFINSKFKGHALSRLVGGILAAQGYQVYVSPEGPDGGVDVIAGKGALGFEAPRLVVQVKSREEPIDIGDVRELNGVLGNFNAEQGLIVSWGGYRNSVGREIAQRFFKTRLWDSDELVRQLQENYDQLPDDIQAELPVKRIWVLARDEEE